MKLMLVIGVRPHFVKISVLLKKLEEYFDVIMVHTGQHYDHNLSDIFFEDLKIRRPNYNIKLDYRQASEQLFAIGLEITKIIYSEKPNLVLVIGDSNTPFTATLAAFHCNIPVGHIEAGVRNFAVNMVEEINRVFIDKVSEIHFAPTRREVTNLINEGINKNVHYVGDLLLEAAKKNQSLLLQQNGLLKSLNLNPKEFVLVTLHRKENTDNIQNLNIIIDCFANIKQRIIFPLHPRTKNVMQKSNLLEKLALNKNISIVDPLSYSDILWAEKNSRYVITDSNGVQREAYFLHTPCIILRDSTEVIGTLKNSCSILTENNPDRLINSIKYYEECPELMFDTSEFGDGNASERIAEALRNYLRFDHFE